MSERTFRVTSTGRLKPAEDDMAIQQIPSKGPDRVLYQVECTFCSRLDRCYKMRDRGVFLCIDCLRLALAKGEENSSKHSAVPSDNKVSMTNTQLYVRLLTELHHSYGSRSTDSTRVRLQDVLVELKSRSAVELGLSDQVAQDRAEAEANVCVSEQSPNLLYFKLYNPQGLCEATSTDYRKLMNYAQDVEFTGYLTSSNDSKREYLVQGIPADLSKIKIPRDIMEKWGR